MSYNMEADIITQIREAGIGLGSLLILAFLFVYQLKTNEKMLDKFGANIDKNTEATQEMTKTLISMNETSKQMVEASAHCRFNQK